MDVQDVLVLTDDTLLQTGLSYSKPYPSTMSWDTFYMVWSNSCDDSGMWKILLDIQSVQLPVYPEFPPDFEPAPEPEG